MNSASASTKQKGRLDMIADEVTEPLTDDEWREERFTEEELVGARLSERHGKTTFKQLKDALEKYGPDGILETAMLLPRAQFEELERLCKARPVEPRHRRRRRR